MTTLYLFLPLLGAGSYIIGYWVGMRMGPRPAKLPVARVVKR